MTHYIDIQNPENQTLPLTPERMNQLVTMTLTGRVDEAELTIRFVDKDEMTHLNHMYRKKNAHTNVLAFPAKLPPGVTLDYTLLGDVIICPAVLVEESIQLHKTLEEHWSLILIHGVLHLLGYDHINDEDAKIMQGIEIQLLTELGYDNPYDQEEVHFE